MNHVQKMVLVPAELRQQTPQIKGVGSVLSSLDEELEAILRTRHISADEKWRRYSSVLSRYLRHLDEERKPIAIPVLGEERKKEQRESEEDEQQEAFLKIIRDDIPHVIPKKFQSLATVLYDRLASPLGRRLITWDQDGQVTIEGAVIPHSHILDFISDVCRARKSFHVHGWQKFAAALKQLGLPADLIGNPKYQKGSGLAAPPRAAARAAAHHAAPRHASTPPHHARSATRRHAATAPRQAQPVSATPRHATTPACRGPTGSSAPRSALPFAKWRAW